MDHNQRDNTQRRRHEGANYLHSLILQVKSFAVSTNLSVPKSLTQTFGGSTTRKMKSTILFTLTTWLLGRMMTLSVVDAFGVSTKSSRNTLLIRRYLVDESDGNKDRSGGGVPPEEEMTSYSSSVDWDAEWKKVVQQQKNGGAGKSAEPRPGQGYYKTEAEIKAIQAANKAAQQAARVQASLPSWQMLKGDWKVGVGCLYNFVRVRACVCVRACAHVL